MDHHAINHSILPAEPTVRYASDLGDPIVIPVGELPPISVSKLLQLGMTSYFGNGISAKVSAERKKIEDATGPMSPEAYAEMREGYIKEGLEALLTGNFPRASIAPRGTAVDTIFNGLVEAKCKTILQLNRLTMPTGEKTVSFPDGQGGEVYLTRADLLARVAKRYGEALRTEAEEVHRKRLAEAAAALRASEGASGLESLGL